MDLHNNYQFEVFNHSGSYDADFKKGSPFHYPLLVVNGTARQIRANKAE